MAFCVAVASVRPRSTFMHPARGCRQKEFSRPHATKRRPARVRSSMVNIAPAFVATNVGQAVSLNSILYVLARLVRQHALTHTGLLHAYGLGVLLWSCLSWQGYVLCFSFLILGSLVTKIGRTEKEALGIAEKREGARGPENLWGAAGVAAICALGAFLCKILLATQPGAEYQPLHDLFLLGYTASLATKISDTTASEIGKAYGSVTYLVTTLQAVPKGTEGAVSAEGTLAGMFASLVAAIYALAVGLLGDWRYVGIVLVAAFVATSAESFIGATIQEDYQWSNEFVNFVNTGIGAVVAMLLGWLLLFFQ